MAQELKVVKKPVSTPEDIVQLAEFLSTYVKSIEGMCSFREGFVLIVYTENT